MRGLTRRGVLVAGASLPVLARASVASAQAKRVKIGAFGPETGPNAVSYTSLQGTIAYFKAVNDAGGIGGYTFDYIVIDDQYNPALTVSAARRLVEQEQVLALVNPIGTGPVMAVKDYLEAKKVPSAGLAVSTNAAGPYNYLLSPDYTNEGAFQAEFAVKQLAKTGKLAIIYQNDDIGKAYLRGAQYIVGQSNAVKLVPVPFQQSTIDFTPAVGIAQQSGAEVAIMSGTPNFFAPIVKAAEALTFRPQWLAASYHGSPAVLKQLPGPQTTNMFFVTYTAVPGTPDVAELDAALKKYFPSASVASLTTLGWSSGTIFGQAFKRMVEGGKEPSREALTDALNATDAYSNSVIRNITYKPGPGIASPHIPRPFEAVMKWNGTGFDVVYAFGAIPKVPGQPGQ